MGYNYTNTAPELPPVGSVVKWSHLCLGLNGSTSKVWHHGTVLCHYRHAKRTKVRLIPQGTTQWIETRELSPSGQVP